MFHARINSYGEPMSTQTLNRPAANERTDGFGGDKKHGQSMLHRWERPFIDRNVPKLPSWLMSHHLTMLTVAWSAAVLVCGWLAQDDPRFLFGISAAVALQWLTDSFDGSLGKYRKQGLVKWGFFMDHFLDLVFAGCLVIAYSFVAPEGMMGLSFLGFAATNKFQIAFMGIGPTEIRIAYIAINTVLFFVGTSVFTLAVPIALAGHIVVIVAIAWKMQRSLWYEDLAANIDGD